MWSFCNRRSFYIVQDIGSQLHLLGCSRIFEVAERLYGIQLSQTSADKVSASIDRTVTHLKIESAAFSPPLKCIALCPVNQDVRDYRTGIENTRNLFGQWRGYDGGVREASLPCGRMQSLGQTMSFKVRRISPNLARVSRKAYLQ